MNQASVRWRQPRSLLWATQAEVIIHYQIGGIIHIIVTHRLAMRRTRSVKFNAGHPEHSNIRICYHFPSVAKTVEQWSNTIGVSRKGAVNRRDSYREIIYAQDQLSPSFHSRLGKTRVVAGDSFPPTPTDHEATPRSSCHVKMNVMG